LPTATRSRRTDEAARLSIGRPTGRKGRSTCSSANRKRRSGRPTDTPLQLTLSKTRLIQLAGGDTESAGVELRGDAGVLQQILGVLDQADPNFEIVLP
jgi:alkyl sulfatase BDS1-like metallo-beta-lactamase superfamily hydrolase